VSHRKAFKGDSGVTEEKIMQKHKEEAPQEEWDWQGDN